MKISLIEILGKYHNYMKLFLALFLLPILSAAQIKVAGEMRNIMQKADLAGTIDLDTLKKENLYGLGVVEGLKGEIMIVDGNIFVTSVDNGHVKSQQSDVVKAAMLVYSKVEKWSPVSKPGRVQSLGELETYIESVISAGKNSSHEPFAFLIKTKKATISHHVIDWYSGTHHTMSNHKQFATTGESKNDEVTILGFYSDHHQGVFTHHDSKIHLHVLINETKIVGHIDQLQLQVYDLFIGH